jgi:hypothetical protein
MFLLHDALGMQNRALMPADHCRAKCSAISHPSLMTTCLARLTGAHSAITCLALLLAACGTGRPAVAPAIDNTVGLLLPSADSACFVTTSDGDDDGLSDACELALASASRCDRGHSSIDTCDRNRMRYRFPILSRLQNIGSRAHPAGAADGCVGPDHIGWHSNRANPGEIECLWSRASPFRGWQAPAVKGAATSYGRYLDEIAAF